VHGPEPNVFKPPLGIAVCGLADIPGALRRVILEQSKLDEMISRNLSESPESAVAILSIDKPNVRNDTSLTSGNGSYKLLETGCTAELV